MRNSQNEFSDLHNRLYGKVFSFVKLRIRDSEEVKDIVQDVFMRAFKSWDKIPDETSAKNFLYMVAKQRMIDIWRSSRFKSHSESSTLVDEEGGEESLFDHFESGEPLPEEVFEENEKKKHVLNLLNSLKESDREILILRYLEELEYKELASIYKTSEGNIRQKVSRSLQNLKKVVEKGKEIKI
jgi:RNA polymerase sigma-70 factor (ECF subfamily)